jgi:hypothetical protein
MLDALAVAELVQTRLDTFGELMVLVQDGFGLWLCARWLYLGRFAWAGPGSWRRLQITHEQLQGLVVGLAWHRIGEAATIRML